MANAAKKSMTTFAPYLLGIPSDARARLLNESQLSQTSVKSERESARDVCLKLLPQFLKDAMMVVQATSGEDDQADAHRLKPLSASNLSNLLSRRFSR